MNPKQGFRRGNSDARSHTPFFERPGTQRPVVLCPQVIHRRRFGELRFVRQTRRGTPNCSKYFPGKPIFKALCPAMLRQLRVAATPDRRSVPASTALSGSCAAGNGSRLQKIPGVFAKPKYCHHPNRYARSSPATRSMLRPQGPGPGVRFSQGGVRSGSCCRLPSLPPVRPSIRWPGCRCG